jgi:hypothetical protein
MPGNPESTSRAGAFARATGDASASGDSQSVAFVKKQSHGTTVMMLYVMVNCNVVDEKDAEVLINAE